MKKQFFVKNIAFLLIITSGILCGMKKKQDKLESFSLGISGYMIKPVDYIKFLETIRTIDIYWTLSEIP